MIRDKTVILGVTGSIAAYKAVDLASKLTQAGARVEVVMTRAATEFVTPLSFSTVTGRPAVTEMFGPGVQQPLEGAAVHVALGQRADVVVIAPVTANVLAKLAVGLADDELTCTVLATKAPVIVAPAMNLDMFRNPATQENLARLRSRGFIVVGPAYGRLASGKVGPGRLADVEEILGTVCQVLGRNGDLAGRRLVVSAGGTQEPIDPIRVITNRSSGRMGYALAEAARDRGAQVVLVSAPTALPDPVGVEVRRVQTALQMRDEVMKALAGADALVMAAAVADYRPLTTAPSKIKKGAERLSLELVRNPDILDEARGDFVRVGFAAESENLVENAREKLRRKELDLIVANDVNVPESGFGAEKNKVVILDRAGGVEELPVLPKSQVADRILDRLAKLLTGKKKGE